MPHCIPLQGNFLCPLIHAHLPGNFTGTLQHAISHLTTGHHCNNICNLQSDIYLLVLVWWFLCIPTNFNFLYRKFHHLPTVVLGVLHLEADSSSSPQCGGPMPGALYWQTGLPAMPTPGCRYSALPACTFEHNFRSSAVSSPPATTSACHPLRHLGSGILFLTYRPEWHCIWFCLLVGRHYLPGVSTADFAVCLTACLSPLNSEQPSFSWSMLCHPTLNILSSPPFPTSPLCLREGNVLPRVDLLSLSSGSLYMSPGTEQNSPSRCGILQC